MGGRLWVPDPHGVWVPEHMEVWARRYKPREGRDALSSSLGPTHSRVGWGLWDHFGPRSRMVNVDSDNTQTPERGLKPDCNWEQAKPPR